MRLSQTLLQSLRKLAAGETIAASALRRDVADELLAEGLLIVQEHGSHRSFRATDIAALKNYLSAAYDEFRNQAIWTSGYEMPESRAEQAAASGNSKMVAVRSCPGFLVNSYQSISCYLNGQQFVINPPEGSFIFIADWQTFQIPENIIVVGIENMENFRQIRRQRQLFDGHFQEQPLLFVSRYPQSGDLIHWLQSIPNPYVHFGDFDLAGIHIYLTEFYRYLSGSRAQFLIPDDIEQRLALGSRKRYDSQLPKFKHMKVTDDRVAPLVDMILHYHRGYDQEGYIELV